MLFLRVAAIGLTDNTVYISRPTGHQCASVTARGSGDTDTTLWQLH